MHPSGISTERLTSWRPPTMQTPSAMQTPSIQTPPCRPPRYRPLPRQTLSLPRQTPVKALPSPILRMRSATICKEFVFAITFVSIYPHLIPIVEIKPSMSPFFVPFKNGSNAVLRDCLHVQSKRSKMLPTKTVTLTVRVNKP